jgi:hypothetical protein
VKIQFVEIDGVRHLLHEDSSSTIDSDTVMGIDPISTKRIDDFLKRLCDVPALKKDS